MELSDDVTIVWPCVVNRFLVNKTNRCAEFQFYWYYYSTCFGQPFCPSSGVLSRTSALAYFMQLWWPFATGSRMKLLLVSNGSSQLPKMYQSRWTAKNSWWWAERLPETCRVVIAIRLEFSASVGFIHKECIDTQFPSKRSAKACCNTDFDHSLFQWMI
jgi:hypothetical protein